MHAVLTSLVSLAGKEPMLYQRLYIGYRCALDFSHVNLSPRYLHTSGLELLHQTKFFFSFWMQVDSQANICRKERQIS